MQGYSVDVSNGWGWYIRGWKLFVSTIMVWVWLMAASVCLILLFGFIFGLIPFLGLLGQLALSVLVPVILGGIYYTIDQANNGHPAKPRMLLRGFDDKSKTLPLIIVGLLLMGSQVLLWLFGGAMMGGPMMGGMMSGEPFDPTASISGFSFLGMAISFVLGAAITLAFLYAVPLVMLDNVSPVEAIKTSFVASISNIVPLVIFGLIYFVLALVAAIPVFIGFLILMPVTFCALYHSYTDIFANRMSA